jgi:hypothetical protein
MTITQSFQRQVSTVPQLREHYPTVVPRLLTYRTQAEEEEAAAAPPPQKKKILQTANVPHAAPTHLTLIVY